MNGGKRHLCALGRGQRLYILTGSGKFMVSEYGRVCHFYVHFDNRGYRFWKVVGQRTGVSM